MASLENSGVTTLQPNLRKQDLTKLDVSKLNALSPEVISRQATINIGTIGHVAHGKSTVVKAISGVQTVRFKNELERNITIKLERLQFDVKGNVKNRNISNVRLCLDSLKSMEKEARGEKRKCEEQSEKRPGKRSRKSMKNPVYSKSYTVEKLEKCELRYGVVHFYVKWENWPEDSNTWEPVENLDHCPLIMEKFLDQTLTPKKLDNLKARLNITEDFDLSTVLERYKISDLNSLPPKLKLQQDVLNTLMNFPFDHHRKILENARKSFILYDLTLRRHEQLSTLKIWIDKVNAECTKAVPLAVENSVDLELLPSSFKYIEANILRKGVRVPKNVISGCECVECGPRIKACCGRQDYFCFTYTKTGKMNINPGNAVFECNKLCKCPATCRNRVVQSGSKVPLCIFRTDNGRGWGVKTLRRIGCGEFICEYVGEVITHDEAEHRGKKYDAQGRTYLFDLDYNTKDNPYTIDAARFGNVSHFINHSCDPNCAVWAVWVDTLDPNLPRLAIFSLKNIEKNEELTFDYVCTPESPTNTPEKGAGLGRSRLDTPDKNSTETAGRILCRCSADKCRKHLF